MEATNTVSLSSSALLVSLNISVWPANVLDRTVTDSVTSAAHANADAGRFMKNLFAGTNLRKDIEKYAAHCRVTHLRYTMPWADKGERLLTNALFMEYKAHINTMEVEFDRLCTQFFAAYPQLVADAPVRLGKLYNPDDYPSLDAVKAKFGFRFSVCPLPDSGDFRLDVPTAALEELKQQYEETYKQRLADAMRDPWGRLHKMLSDMSEKLADSDDEKKKRFHDSFLGNPRELCRLLTAMNITKDPALEEARQMLEQSLMGVDIDELRESSVRRATVKSKVDSILSKFDF